MKRISLLSLAVASLAWALIASPAPAEESTLRSPDGKITVTVCDTNGLSYRVTMDGQAVVGESTLGLKFESGPELGPHSKIVKTSRSEADATWENRFGKRRTVRDQYREMRVELDEPAGKALIVRAYNDGVAFRYDLPQQPGFTGFVITEELTGFAFPENYRCWGGEMSSCVECQYPEQHLLNLSGKMVLPLLVELPHGYCAIAESDLLDWAGLFLKADHQIVNGKFKPVIAATLAGRADRHGCVVSQAPRHSPWRVLMLGRTAATLINSDLIANLATPSRIADVSWIKPGITAWDPWWAKSCGTRGTTATDKPYIDFAAEMGWPYQLVDWGWCKDKDVTQLSGSVDVPGLLKYAKGKGVKLLLWMHNKSLRSTGEEKAFSTLSAWGIPGVKIDFMDSDSQEMVQWYEKTLELAAKYKLLVDFHGAYKPAGLARTWPNYITQEGVLGNEYNKLAKRLCTPSHHITLPFTRGLLGPMDFTPGGFVNRTETEFVQDAGAYPGLNTQVLGTRARQLAMTVIYESPLLCLADSPEAYRGQPGVEFLRGLPTVWDETVVPSARVAREIVIARRSGDAWWVAGMNANEPLKLTVPLDFLRSGKWTLRSFADTPESAEKSERISETAREIQAGEPLSITLAPAGGFAAVLRPVKEAR